LAQFCNLWNGVGNQVLYHARPLTPDEIAAIYNANNGLPY
jgi:hypothetical protein